MKFCTECGGLVQELKKFCTQGHEILAGKKFCEVCGESVNATALETPSTQTFSTYSMPAVNNSQSRETISPTFVSSPFTPPKENSHSFIPLMGAAGVLLILIIGTVFYNLTKVTYTNVSATMTLIGSECYDISWGFFDIPGGEVVLEVDGAPVAYASYPSYGDSSYYLGCRFSTTFYDVPMDGNFYSFGLANGRRGTLNQTQEEMVSNDWSFSATLG